MKNQDIEGIRHSLAHLLAQTVKEMYPGSLNAIGPVIENGFYQDFEIKGKISEDDLPKIEEAMRLKLERWTDVKKQEVSLSQAQEIFKDNKYKLELAEEFAEGGKTLTVYTMGGFDDLCKGGHADNLSLIDPDSFKLAKTAGAYWRGDEKNIMLARIYGVAFYSKEELDAYLKQQELAKERDHRKLGRELDLFVFSDLVGSGLPMFTPRGAILKRLLWEYSSQLRSELGFEQVFIPHITKIELYETSGHAQKFGDELFLVESQETSDKMVLKPMNCPHHTQIYASRPRSYRDLPIMYQENTVQYRDEKSGELHGLSRVRSISIDDSHAFVAENQIDQVINGMVLAVKKMYQDIGMSLKFRLSFRDDSDEYIGDVGLWDRAQSTLIDVAKANDLDYFTEQGEAAFYGPKIDFIAVDSMNREWQLATVQLDFVQPTRFDLKYVDEDGQQKHPVMLHYAILGSAERFLSVYLEHTGGHFPFWLAPEQVRVVTVNDSVKPYAEQVEKVLSEVVLMQPLKFNELRFSSDERKENLGKKIRFAEEMKIPLIIIVGPKDQEAKTVSLRYSKNGETVEDKIKLDELADWVLKFNG